MRRGSIFVSNCLRWLCTLCILQFSFVNFQSSLYAAAPPNVVYILVDDMGYGDLSCYGQRHFNTPEIDRLAGDGVRFTAHYAGSTVCAPSRCTLMTGRDTGHCTIRGNGPVTLRSDEITVAELLQQSGYRTATIGKSCVTARGQNPEQVLSEGFDVFYGTTHNMDGHKRYPTFIHDQTNKIGLPGNHSHHGEHYDAELYTQRAEQFIAENPDDQPFFLLLSYPIPHASVLAPEGEVVSFENDNAEGARFGGYTKVTRIKGNYAGMIRAIDGYVGRVMEALRDKGVADETLVMFSSDNGSHFEGGYDPRLLDSNGSFRGGKRDLYEGGIRVPFIAHWPAGIDDPGRVSDHPSAFWDLLPTLQELIGRKLPDNIQGISFAPTLTGKGEQKKHATLYWEFHERGGRRALRQGNWKIVQYGLQPGALGDPELYDLATDPSESDNLADSHPNRLTALIAKMNSARVPSKNFPMPGLDETSR